MRTILKSNVDLLLAGIALAMILAAVTVLWSWPWALLLAGIALFAFATMVIE